MKLVINDWGFLITNGLVSEAKYEDVIKKLKKGDSVEYTDKNGDVINFQVILNDNGQIYLKNLDGGVYKNNYFFITVSDLVNNNLSFRTINFVKNLTPNLQTKDDITKLSELLKQFPIPSWKLSTFKNLDKLIMGSEKIDMVKPDVEDDKFKNYIQVKDVEPFLEELRSLKAGMVYRFTLSNGGTIELNLISNDGKNLFFEYNKLTGAAKSHSELINAELMLNLSSQNIQQKVSSVVDEENVDTVYSITFNKLKPGEDSKGNRLYDKYQIKNIKDIEPASSFDSGDKDKSDSDETEKLTDKEIDDMSAEDITKLVLSDPTFKAAFIKKPNFWDAILKRKPKGIIAAKKILRNVKGGVYDTRLRSGKVAKETPTTTFFKNNQMYFIQLEDKSFVKGPPYDVNIDINNKYRVKAKKRTNLDGDVTVYLTGDGFTIKILSLYGDSKNKFTGEVILNPGEESEYKERRIFSVTDAY